MLKDLRGTERSEELEGEVLCAGCRREGGEVGMLVWEGLNVQ